MTARTLQLLLDVAAKLKEVGPRCSSVQCLRVASEIIALVQTSLREESVPVQQFRRNYPDGAVLDAPDDGYGRERS